MLFLANIFFCHCKLVILKCKLKECHRVLVELSFFIQTIINHSQTVSGYLVFTAE